MLCALATISDTAAQLGPHARACLQTGNTKTEVVAALVYCFPYVGFPRAVAAIRAVKDLQIPTPAVAPPPSAQAASEHR